jgi:predicted component of type VI protein secretion system
MTFRLKAASGPHTGQSFDLSDNTAIGSSDEADIRIDGVEKKHARIVFDGETLTLETSAEAWINGEPASRMPLKSGDEIRFGQHRFVLQAPGLRPPSVLKQVEQRPGINPWTWVVVAAVALAGVGGMVVFVVSRMG